MNQEIEQLKKEIELIKERNRRVEIEKGWETSTLRKVSICILTYAVMCLVMLSIGVKDFYISAIVPTLGFFYQQYLCPLLKNIG